MKLSRPNQPNMATLPNTVLLRLGIGSILWMIMATAVMASAKMIKDAGADILVAGSAIFSTDDPHSAIEQFKNI